MKKQISMLTVGLLLAAPVFSTTPDDNKQAGQTLIVNNEKVERIVSEIRLDGNNAILLFTDGDKMTADMRLVTLTMSYDEATGISSLNMKDKDGNVKVYDLQGRRIANSQQQTAKGIRIVNGKKVVNKQK